MYNDKRTSYAANTKCDGVRKLSAAWEIGGFHASVDRDSERGLAASEHISVAFGDSGRAGGGTGFAPRIEQSLHSRRLVKSHVTVYWLPRDRPRARQSFNPRNPSPSLPFSDSLVDPANTEVQVHTGRVAGQLSPRGLALDIERPRSKYWATIKANGDR